MFTLKRRASRIQRAQGPSCHWQYERSRYQTQGSPPHPSTITKFVTLYVRFGKGTAETSKLPNSPLKNLLAYIKTIINDFL